MKKYFVENAPSIVKQSNLIVSIFLEHPVFIKCNAHRKKLDDDMNNKLFNLFIKDGCGNIRFAL